MSSHCSYLAGRCLQTLFLYYYFIVTWWPLVCWKLNHTIKKLLMPHMTWKQNVSLLSSPGFNNYIGQDAKQHLVSLPWQFWHLVRNLLFYEQTNSHNPQVLHIAPLSFLMPLPASVCVYLCVGSRRRIGRTKNGSFYRTPCFPISRTFPNPSKWAFLPNIVHKSSFEALKTVWETSSGHENSFAVFSNKPAWHSQSVTTTSPFRCPLIFRLQGFPLLPTDCVTVLALAGTPPPAWVGVALTYSDICI